MQLIRFSFLALVAVALPFVGLARPSLGLSADLVLEQAESGAFPLVRGERAAPVWVDGADHAGVLRAVGDLRSDIERVTGRAPEVRRDARPEGASMLIAGTLGKNRVIDRLAAEGKLDVSAIAGRWESFVIATVADPLPGVRQALVVAGSDKRGAIYGVYELSEQIGVSPWHWWADVPAARRSELLIRGGAHVQGPPAVKYRGIFINDEEPAFGPWAREKFGGVNSRMYARMYELMLRLRANYLWPAMWGKSLYEDDPESARLADEYGIVVGTSHHEPMMRAHQDWTKRRKTIGNGQWNYATNEEGLKRFFREGIERNKDHETLITVGMRGDGDEPMAGDDDMPANIALLEKVVADQRAIIADVLGRPAATVPQVWSLYKEVADYYDRGMKVPEDVTLLWCDDNWGNIRRLPTPAERARPGGAGVYYHFDYVGSPRSYKWINTNPLPKIWEQMNMAFEHDATRIWVVNVGDLKPMELPIEFFLRLAWNPKALPKEGVAEWTRRWAEREFGAAHAEEIADIVAKYAKYNAWRKPELLEPDTFSFVNHGEAESVLAAWNDLVARADRVAEALPVEARDAFFQLVQYPAKASATVARLHLAAGWNRHYAKQGRASARDQAELARALFAKDRELGDAYHRVAGGKWNHMMAQTRIGYTSWSDPRSNVLPKLDEPVVPSGASLGVAVEGSAASWPGDGMPAVLPGFDSVGRQRRWVDVFRRGSGEFRFSATANRPWVKLSAASGKLGPDMRLWIEIDWRSAPVGAHQAKITITREGGESVDVRVDALRSDKFARDDASAFHGDLTGPAAFDAEAFSANIPGASARWEIIPDYGRGRSGLAGFPALASVPFSATTSPRLEYKVLVPRSGEVRVDLVSGVALDVQPGRGVRVAVAFDDQAPKVVDVFDGRRYDDPAKRGDKSSPAIRGWHDWVKDNAITLKSAHRIEEPGVRTLKVWMIDPGFVLQKVVVHAGEVRPSYFGPPVDRVSSSLR